MKAYQAKYSVSMLCRVHNVSESGYFAWLKREPSDRHLANLALGDRIEAIHRQSRSTYGRPRIQAELREDGIRTSDKRVARLMRERHCSGASRRKWITTTIRDHDASVSRDLVKRDFTASLPDHLWVADITYVPTYTGFLFLAVVLDVCSRRVVGWQWQTICEKSSSLTHSTWRSTVASRAPLFIIPITDRSTHRSRSANAAAKPA